MKLLVNMIVKFLIGLLLVSCLIFIPAGSLSFMNGWLLIILLFVPIFIFGCYLYIKKPNVLKRRLDVKEKEDTQKIVILLSLLVFIAGFIVSGLDYRYGWSDIPSYSVVVGSIILVLSYLLYVEVVRENEFLLRTVKVENEQKLIETGLYSLIRHPMYFSSLLMFMSMPLVLGSLYGLYVFLLFFVIFIVRIHNEEKVLVRDLKGYSKYKLKVKYKLIPYIW